MYSIVFMGTPEFAVASLKALVDIKKYQILAVISQPDRPRGRGKKIVPTPVKAYAESVGLTVLQPAKVKTPEFTAQLAAYKPDFIVVAAFGQILSQTILDIPRFACVNVHASLLPKYRGAAPLNYAIMQGETESGVTLMHMEAGMDTGGSYAQVTVPITAEMTKGELETLCQEAGAQLLVAHLDAIAEGSLTFVPQDESKATKATLLTRQMEHLDWTWSAQRLHDLIRAFNPEPGTFTTLPDGRTLKLWVTRVAPGREGAVPGTVLSLQKKSFTVACGSGALEILELQPESKKRMPAQVFLNGHGITEGVVLGH